MITDKTVIISCAGMGTRLKMHMPKALIDVNGKPLIAYSLEQLKDVEDVRVVVGYKAEDVIRVVRAIRDNVTFVHNDNYKNTGTGASVLLAAKDARKFILTIDGDIIIHPEDMRELLSSEDEFVGVCKVSTDGPVLAMTEKGAVVGFSRKEGEFEWTGVTMLRSDSLPTTTGHTYQIVEPKLPLPYRIIRQREVDTPNDYENAVLWAKRGFKD